MIIDNFERRYVYIHIFLLSILLILSVLFVCHFLGGRIADLQENSVNK